jgi:hypothetical protein
MKRTEKMFSTAGEVPPIPQAAEAAGNPGAAEIAPPTSGPATAAIAASSPTTGPQSAPSTGPAEDLGPVLLLDREGNRYFDGRTRLVVLPRKGLRIEWALPPTATGAAAKVFLVHTPDGLLFLYNQPGRMLRIRPTPDEVEPFVLEATFTRDVPSADDVTRLWVDPAGRMIMAYGNKLAITFPAGYIPPEIADKMATRQAMDE